MHRSKSKHSKKHLDGHSIGHSHRDTHYSSKRRGFEQLPKDFGNFELDFLHVKENDLHKRQEDALGNWGKHNLKSKPKAIQLKKKNSCYDKNLARSRDKSFNKTKHSHKKLEHKHKSSLSRKNSLSRNNKCNNFLDNDSDDDIMDNRELCSDLRRPHHTNFELEDVFTMNGDQLMSMQYFSIN